MKKDRNNYVGAKKTRDGIGYYKYYEVKGFFDRLQTDPRSPVEKFCAGG